MERPRSDDRQAERTTQLNNLNHFVPVGYEHKTNRLPVSSIYCSISPSLSIKASLARTSTIQITRGSLWQRYISLYLTCAFECVSKLQIIASHWIALRRFCFDRLDLRRRLRVFSSSSLWTKSYGSLPNEFCYHCYSYITQLLRRTKINSVNDCYVYARKTC